MESPVSCTLINDFILKFVFRMYVECVAKTVEMMNQSGEHTEEDKNVLSKHKSDLMFLLKNSDVHGFLDMVPYESYTDYEDNWETIFNIPAEFSQAIRSIYGLDGELFELCFISDYRFSSFFGIRQKQAQ